MQPRVSFGLAAIALAVLLPAVPARATSISTATISRLQIQVIDLDPHDGITAGVTFNYDPNGYCGSRGGPYCAGSVAIAQVLQSAPYAEAHDEAFGSPDFGAVSLTQATSLVTATSYVGQEAGGVVVGSTGTAHGGNSWHGYDQSYFNTSAYTPYTIEYAFNFTVTDNTQLLITASADTTARTTVGFDLSVGYGYGYEGAAAYAGLRVSGPGANGSGDQDAQTSLRSEVTYQYHVDPQSGDVVFTGDSDHKTASFALDFTNTSGHALDGAMEAYTQATGYSFANAVPEPSTVAMLAAVHGVVGALARRRSS